MADWPGGLAGLASLASLTGLAAGRPAGLPGWWDHLHGWPGWMAGGLPAWMAGCLAASLAVLQGGG